MHYNQGERQAFAASILGIRVDKTTSALPTIATTDNLFTIAGGLVLMRAIVGEITVVIETQANAAKLQALPTPTTAGDTDLCAALDIGAVPCDVGCLLSITGTPGDAMLVVDKGSCETMLPKGVVLQEGHVALHCAATNTGEIKWSMWYIPIDKGAYVTMTA